MSSIIGIDLGTSYSSVAVFQDGAPRMIPNLWGSHLTPSVVHIMEDGRAVVGGGALRLQLSDPANTVAGIKRLIGRRFNEVMDLVPAFTYSVFPGDNNLATVLLRGRPYSPQFISALILRSLKSDAERYLRHLVTEAVITVPAYFTDTQREATKQAAKIAGLDVKRLINEPTAAAFAYHHQKNNDETIAVFDLGGGTFDISILEVGEGVEEVKSTGGDGFLGGDDFDERIVEWIAEEVYIKTGNDITADATTMQFIRSTAVVAKHDLSQRTNIPIIIPPLSASSGVMTDLTLSRDSFRYICAELFQRLEYPCKQALRDAGLQPEVVNSVLLVGGATRMPGIAELVLNVFGRLPIRSINPDEAVALGAAVQGGVLSGKVKEHLLLDVVSSSLGSVCAGS